MTKTGRPECNRVDAHRGGALLALCFLLAASGAGHGDEDLTLRQSDFPTIKGTRAVYAFSSADGKSRGEALSTVVESICLGAIVLAKTVTTVNGNPLPASWWVLSPDRVRVYRGEMLKEPEVELPLPLKAGASGGAGKSMPGAGFRVEKEESLTLPAGTFRCLVCHWRRDGSPVETWWIAPRVGVVQRKTFGLNPMTTILMSEHKARSAVPPKDGTLLVDFEPLHAGAATVCPNALWKSYCAGPGGLSFCDTDDRDGARGTSTSLRWSYHTRDQVWVQADVLLTGSWRERFDLTPYDSISFFIKGFRAGKCAFMIHGQPMRKGDETWVNIPVDYSAEWQEVTISLRQPELRKLDLRNTAQVSLGHLATGDDGNVIWFDEVVCHKRPESAKKN